MARTNASIAAGFIFRRGIEGAGLGFWLLLTAFAGLGRLFGSDRFTRRRVVDALTQTTLEPLPAISLLAAMIGLVLAFTTSRALDTVHVEALMLLAMRYALMREVMPLLIGIFIIGRSGVGLAVRIGRMMSAGEADALRLMGVAPAAYILPAVLLAFLVSAAGLYVWSIAIAQLANALGLQALQSIPLARYASIVFAQDAWTDGWFGLLRVEIFALIAFVTAASKGSGVGRDPSAIEAVGRETFVLSLLFMFAAVAVLSVLGW